MSQSVLFFLGVGLVVAGCEHVTVCLAVGLSRHVVYTVAPAAVTTSHQSEKLGDSAARSTRRPQRCPYCARGATRTDF